MVTLMKKSKEPSQKQRGLEIIGRRYTKEKVGIRREELDYKWGYV